MSPSVHLIIATYSGLYPRRFINERSYDKRFYLRYNLAILNHVAAPLIEQITIMRPAIEKGQDEIPEYYCLDGLDLSNICDKIRFMDCENVGISYGQFIRAMCLYSEFDYHICIEDDYIPLLDHFDQILVEEHKQYTNGAYVCMAIAKESMKSDGGFNYVTWGPKNCVIPDFSLGMIDKHSVKKLLSSYSGQLDNILDVFRDVSMQSEILHHHQIYFGYILDHCKVPVVETTEHLAVFHANGSNTFWFNNFIKSKAQNHVWEPKDKKFKPPIFMALDALYPFSDEYPLSGLIQYMKTELEEFTLSLHLSKLQAIKKYYTDKLNVKV